MVSRAALPQRIQLRGVRALWPVAGTWLSRDCGLDQAEEVRPLHPRVDQESGWKENQTRVRINEQQKGPTELSLCSRRSSYDDSNTIGP
jgi:hypothetical protein